MKLFLSRLFCSLGILLCLPHAVFGRTGDVSSAGPEPSASPAFIISHHQLRVDLSPDSHRLVATDRLTLTIQQEGLEEISVLLSKAFHVHRCHLIQGEERQALPFSIVQRAPGEISPERSPSRIQYLLLPVPEPMHVGQQVHIDCAYDGIVNHPPQGSSHLKFVTPDQTGGHIGLEGVYLSGETQWYLHHQGSLPTFQLDVSVPTGWEVVTHGKEISRQVQGETIQTTWRVKAKTEALTVVANQFVKEQRMWQGIELSTYLFPEDAQLSPVYLDAIERYLALYSKLLGPYPFPKFSVVENFFPSGLGMPSFTLLGSGVIKRRYIQPYALGHEIVHSWIGNWVYNNVDHGNWVEGLTTYLANYYYEELTGTKEQATEQRRKMLLGYAVHVSPEEEYPLQAFRFKTEQKDNAIGYQKAAMLFHMLRQEIGDEAFWIGIRSLVAQYAESYATWGDLEQSFSAAAGHGLRQFFAQWVERHGAPLLTLQEARVLPDVTSFPSRTAVPLEFQLHQQQQEPPFHIRVPLQVLLQDGSVLHESVVLSERTQTYRFDVAGAPRALLVDPTYAVFHRLPRRSLPPMLNLYMTDHERALAVPDGGNDVERAPYQKLAERILSKQEGRTMKKLLPADTGPPTGSVMVLGGPHVNSRARWATEGCGENVQVTEDSFSVGGETYTASGMALLVSCRPSHDPNAIVTLFYGLTPSAAGKVARLLFFYGWDSYVVFRNGRVLARGDFSSDVRPLEVRFDTP